MPDAPSLDYANTAFGFLALAWTILTASLIAVCEKLHFLLENVYIFT